MQHAQVFYPLRSAGAPGVMQGQAIGSVPRLVALGDTATTGQDLASVLATGATDWLG